MIHIISGESYQADVYIQEVKSAKLKEGYEPYSFDAEKNTETGAELLHLLRSQGLFQKNKVIIVRNTHTELIKTIAKKYSKEKGGDVIIFFAQRKLSSIVGKHVFIKHFDVPQGQALKRFIKEECKKRNMKPPYQIVNVLFSSFSSKESNLFSLVNEIEKFSLAPRYASDVLILPAHKNPFEITDALARRNKAQAMSILERELQSGSTSFDIVNRILWQLRVLLLVHDYTLNPRPFTLNLHPFVIKKARQALALFSRSELAAYYREAISLYGQILFSGLPSELLLSRFFWKF